MKISLEELDKKLDAIKELAIDEKTEKFKWKKPNKMKSLEKKSEKKQDYILVEYLRQNYTRTRMLCKVIGGNIIVVENKVHAVNPRYVWREGKSVWYLIREIDRLPISNSDYDKLIKQKRITVNDAVIIKAIVGAIQKKEMSPEAKKYLIWIVVIVVALILGYIFFVK